MIAAHAGTILVVTGAITAAPIVVVFAPTAAIRLLFGVDTADAVTIALMRHWSLLVALVGCLLIYAASNPEVRVPIMAAAAVEKIAVGLIFGMSLRRTPALSFVIAADAIMAIIYVVLLAVKV